MGMFDTLTCHYPLPDGAKITRFQTKSLECLLDHYTITEAGRLTTDWTAVPDEGPLAAIQRTQELSDYTGVIVFYGSDDQGVWHEYQATFIHGQLEKIDQVKP